MEGVRRRRRGEGRLVEEACVMNWLMRGGGYVWGMEFLETAMAVRAYVLGEDRYNRRVSGSYFQKRRFRSFNLTQNTFNKLLLLLLL